MSRNLPGAGPASRALRFRRRRTRRGVSDVVATIILLALTVTLFAAIFAFVTSFPPPPAQNSNQFQATLLYNAGSTAITGLNITHLAGPVVPSNALIYLKSAHNPGGCPFTGPVTVSSGISTPVWSLGQVWNGPFSNFAGCSGYTDPVPDNITVYIISQGNLLYSVVLPGQTLNLPPAIVSTWTYPSLISPGSSFKVDATITGNLGTHKAYINLGGITGYSGSTSTVTMWYNSSQSAWQFNVTGSNASGVTTGTYTGVINVTGVTGQTAAASVTITFLASVTFPTLSVAPSIQPSPVFARLPETLYAAITNPGTSSVTITSVVFSVYYTSNTTLVRAATTVTTTRVVAPYSSVTIQTPSTATWLPLLATTYNLTVQVVFSSGTATGWLLFSASQPFAASVTPSPATVGPSTNATFVITLSNFGPVTGTSVNISLFVIASTNGSTVWTSLLTSNGHGGWWVTNSSTTGYFGAYSTLSWGPSLKSPSGSSATYTVKISVTLKNSLWYAVYTFSATNTVKG